MLPKKCCVSSVRLLMQTLAMFSAPSRERAKTKFSVMSFQCLLQFLFCRNSVKTRAASLNSRRTRITSKTCLNLSSCQQLPSKAINRHQVPTRSRLASQTAKPKNLHRFAPVMAVYATISIGVRVAKLFLVSSAPPAVCVKRTWSPPRNCSAP